MAYICETPFQFSGGLSTLKKHTSSVAPSVEFEKQPLIHQATQRPGKLARELADSELKTGSHPINIAGAFDGDVRPLFASGTCSRSPLCVRSTTCSAVLPSTEGHVPMARPRPAGGAMASIATSTTRPARIYDRNPRIFAFHIPVDTLGVAKPCAQRA